ncbi:MAG: DUF1116 domain-containing protein [Proteobacteria bacterium]|nr:MAG: DUF1116 domain-containing protein [Pseudomonadota bacterium]
MRRSAVNDSSRTSANHIAFQRLCSAEPVLIDVRPAIEVLPGFSRDMVLTSGPTLPWSEYSGGQREAIIGGVLFEGLAGNRQDAEDKLNRGKITVAGCQEHACVGSLAGIYTASMPVFVVKNDTDGNMAACNMYEGTNPRRLNYGVYDEGVRERLIHIQENVAPIIGEAVRASGGIRLKPIMRRALHMGDELHSRNTAASLLFVNELYPYLLDLGARRPDDVKRALKAVTEDHYSFLRLSMAAAKVSADAAHGVEGSSVVTAMSFNCKNFAIRVSGLGDEWHTGPHASVDAKLFDGHSADEISWMGGESIITETIGLGGFAQAAAFPLQKFQGGSPDVMVKRNLEMYGITIGENPDYHIPYLGYRGTPTGIDVFKVVESGVTPIMDIGIAGRDGGQIGAGAVRAPKACFEKASRVFRETYDFRSHG